jgi:predicted nucleic acid-binding protein
MKMDFLDSNVVVYYYTKTEPQKRLAAGALLLNSEVTLSTQVLSETCNVLRKKFKWEWDEIDIVFAELRSLFPVAQVTGDTIERAISLAKRTQYPYYDCLILSSAIEANCSILYSEDLQHNQVIDGVRIVNPFL